MTYAVTTLDNGLRVASEFLPGVETVAVNVSCGVGARYESRQENGISHLLEHMAFKGTKTRSARDIAEAFDNIGGQLNAYTSMELTVYYAKVLKAHAAFAVEMLADIVQHSIIDPAELAREQGVIIQEIGMHLDTPEDLIVDHFDETAFPGQPLGRSILSTQEQVAAFTRDDLLRYMQTHYKPGNMVLSAAGNIHHDELVGWAETHFVMPAGAPAPACERAIYHGGDRRAAGDFEQLHLMMGLPSVTLHSPDYHALQVYASILGGGMSSRLFQEVREKRGLAYTVYAMGSAYEDVGLMSIYAATAPEQGGELSRVLCQEIRHMAETVSDVELIRAKNQLKAELLMSRENPQSVAGWIGRHMLLIGRYRDAKEIIGRIDAVSKEDVLRLAGDIARGKLTLAALGDVAHIDDYTALSGLLASSRGV